MTIKLQITDQDLQELKEACQKNSWQFCFGYFQAIIGASQDPKVRELSTILFNKIREETI